MHPYSKKLIAAMSASRSLLSVGLDPVPSRIPIESVVDFNRAIVDATADLVCAYKPNLAFYEAMGFAGIAALAGTLEHIRAVAPAALVIGDGKRGDVGSTSTAYAKAMFEIWNFDATTVNAYGGGESLKPFLDYEDRGVYVWCRSSNIGGSELQDLRLETGSRLFEHLALRTTSWDSRAAIGLVAGAPYPKDVASLRQMAPDTCILAPGIGAQKGDLEATVKGGIDACGRGLIVNSSRGILYASPSPSDFAQSARKAAIRLRDDINTILDREGLGW